MDIKNNPVFPIWVIWVCLMVLAVVTSRRPLFESVTIAIAGCALLILFSLLIKRAMSG